LPGSGKSLYAVREICLDHSGIHTFTNIDFKIKLPHVHILKPEHFVKVTQIGEKKDGTPINKIEFNKQFWLDIKKQYKRINVVLDEAHLYMDSRNFSSKLNRVVMSNFIALIRKLLGGSESSSGKLVLITQLYGRIDNRAREMATQIIKCVCYYTQTCTRCGTSWGECNESPEPLLYCPNCNSEKLERSNQVIEVVKFTDAYSYQGYTLMKLPTQYATQRINDGTRFFKVYDTNQVEGLIEDIVEMCNN
jgi:hypothetical protein